MAPKKQKKTSPARQREASPRRRVAASAPGGSVTVTRAGRPAARLGAASVTQQATRMLAVLGLSHAELSVALADDATIHELNRTYRKKDKPTDVLSFPQAADALAREPSAFLLGDVVISLDTAARQAAERGHSLADEVITLLAHGVLHLCGFDHPTDEREREMNAYAAVLEAAARSKRGLTLRLRA